MGVVAQGYRVIESYRLDQPVLLVLDLDAERRIQFTREKVARHYSTETLDRLLARSCIVRELDALIVFDEISAVAEVHVEHRHDLRVGASSPCDPNMYCIEGPLTAALGRKLPLADGPLTTQMRR